MNSKMRYSHDCDDCKPLGQFGEADLYYCDQQGIGPTVIARHSSIHSDYSSGLWFAEANPELREAKALAIKAGLLPSGKGEK